MFNPKTNRIINGVCEYCGVSANLCPHYSNQPKPMDEVDRLKISENAPRMPSIAVEPLKAEEKVNSIAEMKLATERQAKIDALQEAQIVAPLVEPENTVL